MEFERAFVKAGGLLLAGPDPTGYGGVLQGFGDQREIQLLVEAGFTPVEAIKIATYNGAQYLGELQRIGTLAPGKLPWCSSTGTLRRTSRISRASRPCSRAGSATIRRN